MHNNTTRLLGLEDLAVVAVADDRDNGLAVYPETADERARACPNCGVDASRMKEWVTTGPRDLPVTGRMMDLRWRERRWICGQADYPRKTFTERVDQAPAWARVTTRLRQATGPQSPMVGARSSNQPAIMGCPGRWSPPRSPRTPPPCWRPSPIRWRCWGSTRLAGTTGLAT
ncbi:hypothetical protein GCM10010174_30850 [Kutzneria viridogrisea]